jgi:hypothetical protein
MTMQAVLGFAILGGCGMAASVVSDAALMVARGEDIYLCCVPSSSIKQQTHPDTRNTHK